MGDPKKLRWGRPKEGPRPDQLHMIQFYKKTPVHKDLQPYHVEFRTGMWAFVCPSCLNVWSVCNDGDNYEFRKHVQEWVETDGCFFKPSNKPQKGTKYKEIKDDF